ncbi:MAG TPA: VWA domain-containing protein [Chitinivibrionales bacterium]|jgi:Ca-activated chloride channel family protein|nr:VWA domain-containing protein [Chitinivibrionales bacterium]
MRFGNTAFFWLMFCIPMLAGLFILAHQWKKAALLRFAAPDLMRRLTPEKLLQQQVLKWVLFTGFVFFAVIALAQPRFGVKTEVVERKGVDVIVALDISRSMLAEDIAPNRLERAKLEIAKLIDLLRGDRVGIVVFAGESFIQCPLTLDYGAAKMFLSVITTEWVQTQGTAIDQAINQSVEAFRAQKSKSRVLIILSDGEENEGDAASAAAKAALLGVKIYTVGLGAEGGAPIPLNKGKGNISYKKDAAGNLVMTRLNPLMLEKIAGEGHGRYFHAGTALDMPAIYGEITKLEKNELGTDRMNIFEEQYQVFLAIALFFLLLEFLVPEVVKSKQQWKGRIE